MKKIINYLNSVQMLVGIFFIILFLLVVGAAAILLFVSDEQLILRIFGAAILLFASGNCMDKAVKHFKKGLNYIRNYTKEERDHAGDLILARVVNGKYL